jgi:microcystin degradation protein MlrC
MSLISQQDRALTIKALEHYTASFKNIMSENERAEANALLNWIKLEYTKHEH